VSRYPTTVVTARARVTFAIADVTEILTVGRGHTDRAAVNNQPSLSSGADSPGYPAPGTVA